MIASGMIACSIVSAQTVPDKSGTKPTVLSLPSGPGSIEGLGKAFQPQINTGTAVYSVSIVLPPGPAGFAPGVELSYNSGSGNSPFGQGWNCMPALSIERQTDKGFPRYRDVDAGSGKRDTFLLGGEELVPLSDGTFRSENETSFRRVRPLSSQVGGPIDSWLIEDRNGTKHWLGRYSASGPSLLDSRLEHPTPPLDGGDTRSAFERTYSWHEDRAEDVNGNRIEYNYTRFADSPGILYLDYIRYFAKNNAANYHEVKFYYESRIDSFQDNRPGFLKVIGRRCREIGISSVYGGVSRPVRSYVLSYATADGALGDIDAGAPLMQKRVGVALSTLHAVTQYGADRVPGGAGSPGTPLPPIRFHYTGFYLNAPITSALDALLPLTYRLRTTLNNKAYEVDPRHAGVVSGVLFQKSDPDNASETPNLIFDALLNLPFVQFADMNGDGLADLLNTETEAGTPRFSVAYNSGNGIFKTASAMVTQNPPNLDLTLNDEGNAVTLADMNGDGMTDLVQVLDNIGKETYIYPNLHDPAKPESGTGFFEVPQLMDLNTPSELSLSGPNARQMDADFDKRTDVLVSSLDGITCFRAGAAGKWTNIGRKDWSLVLGDNGIPIEYAFSRVDPPLLERSNPLVQFADMNGDRLQDLVQIVIADNNEVEFRYLPMTGPLQWGDEVPFRFALSDGTPGNVGRFSIPDVSIDPVDSQNNWDSIKLLDVNGDGLTDVVYVQDGFVLLFLNSCGKALQGPIQITGTPQYQPLDEGNPTILRTLDINGNGSTDLVYFHASGGNDIVGYRYLDFVGGQKPGMLQVIDNGIGSRTFIRYRSTTDDLVRARRSGEPWRTTLPNAMWVVAGMVTDIGLDENGDGETDKYATSFDYRDAYYDGFEKQFRGFSYAQKISWGDDVSSVTGLPTGNALGSPGQPTGVTRYRFMTGSPDGEDNDQYIAGQDAIPPIGTIVDETTERGGREEESLKGKPVWEETVDGAALVDGLADFDNGAAAAADAAYAGDPYGSAASRGTPDKYVYSRTHSRWALRRIYRPSGQLAPKGRLLPDEPAVVTLDGPAGVGKSVTFPVLLEVTTEVIEANVLLQAKFSTANAPFASHAPVVTRKAFDYDNFGNATKETDFGVISGQSPLPDDERVSLTSYVLTRGAGSAIENWIINRVHTSRVEDENGLFVKETRNYYDGDAFTGLPLGQIGTRGLLTRSEQRVTDPTSAIPALETLPTASGGVAALEIPGDPRPAVPQWLNAKRSKFDEYGNEIWSMDPLGVAQAGAADTAAGHATQITYDPVFHTFPVEERHYVGGGKEDLVMTASYARAATTLGPEVPWGFGVMVQSKDFNDNATDYFYDVHARLTAIRRPLDTEALPTQIYTYRHGDPHRGKLYDYNRNGQLVPSGLPVSAAVHGVANSVQTDAREQHGQAGVLTRLAYTDGVGKALMALEEDEVAGQFNVTASTRYGLAGNALYQYQPWRKTGSALELPALGQSRSDLAYDATGRLIRNILPAESDSSPTDRRETRTHYLPLKEFRFDQEDLFASDPAQPHLNTPMVQYKDGLGRLVGVDEVVKNKGDIGGGNAVESWQTRYAYNLSDNLVHIRDSQDNQKWMRYDGLGRRLFMNDPDRGVMYYTYDIASNVVETLDAKAQRNTYTYDGLNRLLSEDYHDEGQPFSFNRAYNPAQPISENNQPDVAFYYDAPMGSIDPGDNTGPLTAIQTKGFLSHVVDLAGEEHISYDQRGRAVWTVKRIPDPLNGVMVSYKTEQTYDALDRGVDLFYPDGDKCTYAYNARSLVESISGGATANRNATPYIVSNYEYRPSGQLSSIVYGNGVHTNYAYDPRLRLRTLTSTPEDGTGTPFIDYAYAFDGASNILAINDQRSAAARPAGDPLRNTQLFQYDDLYRLTNVQYSWNLPGESQRDDGQIAYRYDRIGNMRAQTSGIVQMENGLSVTNLGAMGYGGTAGATARVGRTTAQPGPHALTRADDGVTPRDYPYDDNGNMTNVDGLVSTWDHKDRLRFVENAAMRAEYIYDFTDRRVVKKVWKKNTAGALEPYPSTTAQYIGQYFEVREGDQPVKYLWNGKTRVAKVIGTLDATRPRTQRIRIQPGWNNVATAVTAGDAMAQLGIGTDANLQVTYVWNAAGSAYVPVTSNAQIAAGAALWIKAAEGAMLHLTGAYQEPTSVPVPNAPGVLAVPGLEALTLSEALPNAQDRVAVFDGALQVWRRNVAPPLDFVNPIDDLGVGRVLSITSSLSRSLSAKAATERIEYYQQDHLGSSNAMTDATGTVAEENVLYPFGTPRTRYSGAARAHESYLFTQKERDAESGLQYFEARYLASAIGRFNRVDPLAGNMPGDWKASPQKLNFYTYCGNNPLGSVDSTGLADAPLPNATPAPAAEPPKTIYICSRPLDAVKSIPVISKIMTHSYFKVGDGDKAYTVGLFPGEKEGPNKGQGVPQKGGDPTDPSHDGNCVATKIKESCLTEMKDKYPIGAYDNVSANCNTFTGNISRSCGSDQRPPKPIVSIGFDEKPPASGTVNNSESNSGSTQRASKQELNSNAAPQATPPPQPNN